MNNLSLTEESDKQEDIEWRSEGLRKSIGIDGHIDTIQRVIAYDDDLANRLEEGYADVPRLRDGGIQAPSSHPFAHPVSLRPAESVRTPAGAALDFRMAGEDDIPFLQASGFRADDLDALFLKRRTFSEVGVPDPRVGISSVAIDREWLCSGQRDS